MYARVKLSVMIEDLVAPIRGPDVSIDITPPISTVNFPGQNQAIITKAGWTGAITGTTADFASASATGVQQVLVSIQQVDSEVDMVSSDPAATSQRRPGRGHRLQRTCRWGGPQ